MICPQMRTLASSRAVDIRPGMRRTTLVMLTLAACAGGDGVGDTMPEDPLDIDDGAPVVPDVRCEYGDVGSRLTAEQMGEPGEFEVASVDFDLIDPTRPTPATEDQDGADHRRLATRVYYPADELPWFGDAEVSEAGPFPLIVHSHGFSSSKDEVAPFAKHLASHGFIVVTADFPLSNMNAPGGPTIFDLRNQPGDVSFLIDQMLAKSALTSDPFSGSVDANRIGATGLSLGGLTTSLVTFHPWLSDPRIKASATLAGPSSFFTDVFYHHREVPLLVVHGDIDAFINYETDARHSLEIAQPNVNLVTIEAGTHTGFSEVPFSEILDLITGDAANFDAVGCEFVGDAIEDQSTTDADFFDGIAGDGVGIVVVQEEDYVLPCDSGLQDLPAIAREEQVSITKRALLAHFQAYFGEDQAARDAACQFLNEDLGADPNVTFE